MPANDPALKVQLEALANRQLKIRNYLVLGVTSQSQVAQGGLPQLSALRPERLRADQAGRSRQSRRSPGSGHQPAPAVAYIADGPRIPDDLHPARSHQLVSRAVSLQAPRNRAKKPWRACLPACIRAMPAAPVSADER